jgi:hypothetical protein
MSETPASMPETTERSVLCARAPISSRRPTYGSKAVSRNSATCARPARRDFGLWSRRRHSCTSRGVSQRRPDSAPRILPLPRARARGTARHRARRLAARGGRIVPPTAAPAAASVRGMDKDKRPAATGAPRPSLPERGRRAGRYRHCGQGRHLDRLSLPGVWRRLHLRAQAPSCSEPRALRWPRWC